MESINAKLDGLRRYLQTLAVELATVKHAVSEVRAALDRLPADLPTRQDLTRLCQECTWNSALARQELGTKQDLVSLRWHARQDLARAVETLCDKLARFRLESHREHQDLFHSVEEGPLAERVLAASRPAERAHVERGPADSRPAARVLGPAGVAGSERSVTLRG